MLVVVIFASEENEPVYLLSTCITLHVIRVIPLYMLSTCYSTYLTSRPFVDGLTDCNSVELWLYRCPGRLVYKLEELISYFIF
jgi:hypothetical protein